ncbi:putative PEP-binding protein [Mesoplasma lactucae]|uniref:Uncharacterized protein n=1 Tax=Mesoplasma lactucae ATCC 49193 TaxID=81460 RepID=A0A291IRQ9_9MOLU|nr:putative PEP-binding protein [Mesoplasma lactucae]ATG97615.1 hypothetical protein CP520_02630 [Mesoplasma lactucae ATCC 49193]ATZ19924.1 phosphoenolpyruvate-protein phosphotransferase [Mesoplasma lactucae ATCC 49193]MCL8216788.1 Phosphoenolpyruvate-protein phosphotransferase [Mesoplasma lactucae ATCC 49193]
MEKIQGKTIQGENNVYGKLLFRKPIIIEETESCDKTEIDKFIQAIDNVKNTLWNRINETGNGEYHDALMLVEDPTYSNDIKKAIKKNKISASTAIQKTSEKFRGMFKDVNDEKIKNQAELISLIELLLYRELGSVPKTETLEGIYLIDTLDLYTIEILNSSNTLGIITKEHPKNNDVLSVLFQDVTIISLEGNGNKFNQFLYGEKVGLNPKTGDIVTAMNEKDATKFLSDKLKVSGNNIKTKEPKFMMKKINLDVFVEDVTKAKKYQNNLIVDTNELFMTKRPSVNEQIKVYEKLITDNKTREISFRLLNATQDSIPMWLTKEVKIDELAHKGIRVSYVDQSIFEDQIKAILIASKQSSKIITILLPFVSSNEEFFVLKNKVDQMKETMKEEGTLIKDVEVSIELAIPALAYGIKTIAKEVKEIVLNIDELTQYLLGINKDNQDLQHLFQPLSPVVLNFIQDVYLKTDDQNAKLIIDGKALENDEILIVLMGLGINNFAIDVNRLNDVKKLSDKYNNIKTFNLAQKALSLETQNDVLDLVTKYLNQK